MLINADAKTLEWRCIAHLARDQTAIQEILAGKDFHSDNQKFFKLPSRLIAKIFLFRAIYRGPAFSYAADPQFSYIGDQKFWQKVIDAFYEKYEGIAKYHQRITQEVIETGKLVMPTGRIYEFEPRKRKGEYEWPLSDIANYPVQGFAADIMAIVRVSLASRLALCSYSYLFCNTVHDSIVLDVDNTGREWYNICIETDNAFKNAAKNYELLFGEKLLVPMACEIKVGNNWLWTHHINIKE